MFNNVKMLACFLGMILLFSPSFVSAESEPAKVIIAAIDRSLEVLHDEHLQGVEFHQQRIDRLYDVLEPVFDFEEIARRCLGRHWQNRTQAQRDEFIRLFSASLKKTYLSKSDAYRGEQVQFVRDLQKGNKAKVQTNVILTSGKVVDVDFIMRQRSDWKVYDIIIEGVSTVGSYRSQFNNILRKSSFDELLNDLREKNKE